MEDITRLKAIASSMSILYVEDEREVREVVTRYLKKLFESVYVAANGVEALNLYMEHKIDILLTDIQMPKMNGIALIERVKEINPEQECVIISAFSDVEYLLEAIKSNVHAYIIKPMDFQQFTQTLFDLCRKIDAQRELLLYREELEKLVKVKTSESQENFERTIESMIRLIEMRDTYTAGHSERVAFYSREIAKALNLSHEESEKIYRAGVLHDIGKISTPDTILLKPSRLNQQERSIIQNHVNYGYEILKKIPMYAEMADILLCHHERYDGEGYPNGLKGDEISTLGHIIIIADAFDAMTSSRIYRRKKSVEEAIEEIKINSAKQFHPDLIDIASKVLVEVFKSDMPTNMHSNILEQQRMAYHFIDPVSNAYNLKYLLYLLREEDESQRYTCMHIVKFYNFAQFNRHHSWLEGDSMLTEIAQLLQQRYSDALVFRMHGAHYGLFFKEHREIDTGWFKEERLFRENHFDIKLYHIDFSKHIDTREGDIHQIFSDIHYDMLAEE